MSAAMKRAAVAVRRGLSPSLALLALVVGACRAERVPEPERRPSASSLSFSFVLPEHYAWVELRGEGSERLRAPPGTRVQREGAGFSLESGSEFRVRVDDEAPSLARLKEGIRGLRALFQDDDLIIFEREDAYAFVVVRELIPEWDERDRRRIACSSVGLLTGEEGSPPLFSRSATDSMVAACRSLSLPSLE